MNNVKKLWSDFRGIASACGWGTATRWLFSIAASLPTIVRERQLSAADVRMGAGPFRVRYRGSEARLCGTRVLSGIREVWIRDVYGHGDFLDLPENALVVDLGANIGLFTILALATGPTTRVVAVEPHEGFGETIWQAARLNGFEDRLAVCRAYIGDFTPFQEKDSAIEGFAGAPLLSESEFLARYDIKRIALLKIDIEGSEFAFLRDDSRILDLSDRVAVELHGAGGSAKTFLAALEAKGFRLLKVDWYGEDCIALASR